MKSKTFLESGYFVFSSSHIKSFGGPCSPKETPSFSFVICQSCSSCFSSLNF
uniref:Uncharacterized protein n=1 Tax=Octopus bimaculoides TaxID=37653 RepID=A0A0L8GHU2_OCTBM